MTDTLDLIDDWGPEKIVVVSDNRLGLRGALVIDNTARGMGKGGTRMSPTLTLHEVCRLARVMTWKWAAVDLFFGGAKAGLRVEPGFDREAALRGFVRRLANEIPREYVVGLDVGLTEADAAVVQDELGERGAAVGSPAELGGVPYDQLGVTGFGVAESAAAALSHQGREVAGARVSIQGFGAVGRATALRMAELGAQVVAVSTAQGVLVDQRGLDVHGLAALAETHGDALVHAAGLPCSPRGTELTVDCDVLVPAATQDVIGPEVAAAIQASVVVEGANLPTTVPAQQLLAERGVVLVPDFIANAGGVIAAAYAMDARHSPFRPDPRAIFTAVSSMMTENTARVLTAARTQGSTPHEAARAIAQERVAAAMALKGRLVRA